jgi:cob(I)alamin adenosyltransferase
MKLYTKTGDGGETALFDGTRVLKSEGRVAAYGDVDELNAVLGLALAAGVDEDLSALIEHIQRDLFAVGARLADPRERIAERVEKTDLGESSIRRLEDAIDQYEVELPLLRRFLLPGGNKAASAFHVARAVCRRAERSVVALGAHCVPPHVIQYVNRLSDLLFVLARLANHRGQVAEREW